MSNLPTTEACLDSQATTKRPSRSITRHSAALMRRNRLLSAWRVLLIGHTIRVPFTSQFGLIASGDYEHKIPQSCLIERALGP